MQVKSDFSYWQRADIFESFSHKTFDLLIIGGGVTGCGIALDAASRGLDVLLIEKEDFASGTSSKSTKLIHGGLRYLKQFEFGLVHETGTERAVVHRLARHLVLPEKMLLPITKDGSFNKFSTSIGLKIYDILANVKGDDRRKMLTKKQALKKEPLLDSKDLEGAGYYAEYRTDDARLTIELIKTALRYGAKALNYCSFKEFIKKEGKITAAVCQNELDGNTYQIKARHVVSAAGPWVDQIRKKNGPLSNKSLHLTKGVHIVLPKAKFPLQQTAYFDVQDGRMIFAIPRGTIVYVGTTDTNYVNGNEHIAVSKEDVSYLLEAVNHTFPTLNLVTEDILSSWAGLRPLIHEEGKSPSELSRKDEIFTSDSGLISIAGGKLTGYRKMSLRIVDIVVKRFEKKESLASRHSLTKKIFLTESPFHSTQEVEAFEKDILAVLRHDFSSERAEYLSKYLTNLYGSNAVEILSNYAKNPQDCKETQLAKAELTYCLQNEAVLQICDFIIRRTGRLYFDITSIEKIKSALIQQMADFLKWPEDEIKRQTELLEKSIHEATLFL